MRTVEVQTVPATRGGISAAILELLNQRRDDGFELSLRELRAALLERSKYAMGPRLASAIAMLERSGLVWTAPASRSGYERIPPRVGLTQRSLELVEREGIEGVLRHCYERQGMAGARAASA